MENITNGRVLDNKLWLPVGGKFYGDFELVGSHDIKLTVTDGNNGTLVLHFYTMEDAIYFINNVIKNANDLNEVSYCYQSNYANKRNNLYIIDEYTKLEKRENELLKQINDIKKEKRELTKYCRHEIVCKISNDYPSLLSRDTYYCPCCNEIIYLNKNDDLDGSIFASARVYDLTALSLIANEETLSIIRDAILYNYNEYYRPNKEHKELEENLMDLLKEYESHYVDSTNYSKKKTMNNPNDKK